MKIIDNSYENVVDFASVLAGSCFKHGGNLYMKTKSVEGVAFNAVRFYDGYLGTFKDDTGVRKVEAFVTVEAIR